MAFNARRAARGLRRLRMDSGLTLRALSKASGGMLSVTRLHNLERYKSPIRVPDLFWLGRAYDMKPATILERWLE
jgi:transcriptional regulator with XRE-family HTH domain